MAKKLDIPHDQTAIDDVSSLAAMIKSCDLIITVCNTAVHLAGALGVPCWVLTPNKPAWRYGYGERMPFYKSVRLIQQRTDEWPDVIDRVRRELATDYGIVSRSEQKAA
jgi:ADP-heptose:LPS heptosyltransferase